MKLLKKIAMATGVTLAIGATFTTAPVGAQTPYPTRPVRLVIPFPAGGPTDIVGRLLAQKLSERWGQAVIIDNKAGGSTVIGALEVAKAAPDGYTLLLLLDSTLTMNQALFSKLPYDPLKSFSHISIVATTPMVFMTNSQTNAKTLGEMTALAKAQPGVINFGSGTVSTLLAAEMYKSQASVNLTHVPYKGSSETVKGMLSKDVQTSFDGITPNLPYIKDGTFKPLATTGSKRAASLPNVPTFKELGYPNYDISVWFGLSAPAGTPPTIIDKIRTDTIAVLNTTEIKEKFLALGAETYGSTSEEYVATVQREQSIYGPLIKKLGIKFD